MVKKSSIIRKWLYWITKLKRKFKINGFILHWTFKILGPSQHWIVHYLLFILPLMKHFRIAHKSLRWKFINIKNIMHLILLNSNAYNSCNYFSKSWECLILWESIQSLDIFARIEPFHSTLKPSPHHNLCVF